MMSIMVKQPNKKCGKSPIFCYLGKRETNPVPFYKNHIQPICGGVFYGTLCQNFSSSQWSLPEQFSACLCTCSNALNHAECGRPYH